MAGAVGFASAVAGQAAELPNTAAQAAELPNTAAQAAELPNTAAQAAEMPTTAAQATELPKTATPAAKAAAESGPRLELEGDGASLPAAATSSAGLGAPNDNGERKAMYERTSLLNNLTTKLLSVHNKTTLGGYGEVEFVKAAGQDSYFNHHRYVLFFYSQIHPRISTATELEFEFGGSPTKRDGVQTTGEALLEFAVVDFKAADWLNFRAGIVLVPFGAYNLRHDSPTQDLTDRPLPLTTITPSTWFETGAGVFGKLELGDQTLSYEAYAINGLDAKITEAQGMKGAVGGKGEDNNGDKALVGRVAWAPSLKLELAASGYSGEYDDQQRRVRMLGLDATARFGRVEFQGEFVQAWIDPGYVQGFSASSPANTRAPVPTDMRGWYVQSNIHFTLGWLWSLLPPDLSDAVCTGVLRYEQTDPSLSARNRFDVDKLTVGINFRPVEGYVWKNEVQLVSNGAGGLDRRLWSGGWEFEPKYVTSLAFLF